MSSPTIVDDVCEDSSYEGPLDTSKSNKTNSNSMKGSIFLRPINKYRLSILLCCLKTLGKVRPILEVDVQLLENDFVNGYRCNHSNVTNELKYTSRCIGNMLMMCVEKLL